MLREFAPRDLPELLVLLGRHFPEEDALLGRQPESYERIVRRMYRWDARIALGILRWVGRPVYRFFVVEEAGHLAATTILTFPSRAGYISTVMVDTPYRRRGYARRLMGAAIEATRRTGRGYVVLDVLAQNAPARALYDRMGFQVLRSQAYLLRDGSTPPLGDRADRPGIRPYRRADAKPLVAAARSEMPARVIDVLPPDPGQFAQRDPISTALESVSESWVADVGGIPSAYVAATTSRSVVVGNMTAPIIGPSVDDALARSIVASALRWLEANDRPRVLTEIADHNTRGRRALEAAGFREVYRLDTLVLAI